MRWYIIALKKYAVFGGRAHRKAYWMFSLFNLIFAFVALVLDTLLGTFSPDAGTGVIFTLYCAATFVPSLAVTVRRLHDIGKSGWWILITTLFSIFIIPIIGGIWLVTLLATDSQPGVNRYGPNPKEEAAT